MRERPHLHRFDGELGYSEAMRVSIVRNVSALAALTLLGALSLSGCAAATESEPVATGTAVEFEWLATSAAGQLEGTPDSFTLTMTGVNPQVIQYAERPARFFDTITLDDLMVAPGLWVASNPPNAVLTYQLGDAARAPESLPVVLSEPSWDAATGTLSFHGSVLSSLETLPNELTSVTAAIDGTVATTYQLVGGAYAVVIISDTAGISPTISFYSSTGEPCGEGSLMKTSLGYMGTITPGGSCNIKGSLQVTAARKSAGTYNMSFVGSFTTVDGVANSGSWSLGSFSG